MFGEYFRAGLASFEGRNIVKVFMIEGGIDILFERFQFAEINDEPYLIKFAAGEFEKD
jgi:hypothetical protein